MNLLSFLLFAFVASITPGPTNILVLANSQHFGVKNTVPAILGGCIAASAIVLVSGFTTCNNAAARAVNRTWRLEERFAAGALNSCQLIQESHSTPAQLIT